MTGYVIAGRHIPTQYLTLATWGTIGLGVYAFSRRAKANAPDPLTSSPPINASSPEEEDFIKEFIKNAEAEDKKASGH
ncbi:hypothetical protein G9A89_022965 [Geosiphon pyriformis]|nr:hypothetical protein G9A89_022965 [Geosiphon pyriformis]